MVETTKIIRHARQTKYYLTFSEAEFDYISSHQELSANEKLIWLNIARKSQQDPNLTCTLTYTQISKLIGLKPDTVYRTVKKLKDKGFLKSCVEVKSQIITYTILLPITGMELIKKSLSRSEQISNYDHINGKDNALICSLTIDPDFQNKSSSSQRNPSHMPRDNDRGYWGTNDNDFIGSHEEKIS